MYNAIVNKAAISAKANRMIGGSASSKYLAQLQGHAQAKLNDAAMDGHPQEPRIDPALLRADSFKEFYTSRKATRLAPCRP